MSAARSSHSRSSHAAIRTLSAGVVVVSAASVASVAAARPDDRWDYLLLRSFKFWDFPKGTVEPNESPLEAARREVAEESGLEELDFAWGTIYCETPPYRAGKVARYYVARSSSRDVQLLPNPENGRPEHVEFRWLAYRDARALLVPRLVAVIDWAERVVARPPQGSGGTDA